MAATIQNTTIDATVQTTQIFSQIIAQGGQGVNGTNGVYTDEVLVVAAGTATLAFTPLNGVSVFDGSKLVQGIDFTRNGRVITFLFPTVAPTAIYTH